MACYVCDKHRAGDGVIAGDDLVVLGHVLPDAPGTDGAQVYLGHLIVEPRRHVPGLADLTPDEAAALGQWAARAARALQAEHVYSQVIGHRSSGGRGSVTGRTRHEAGTPRSPS